MTDSKPVLGHVELGEMPNKNSLSPEELELEQALKDYVPNTEAEKKLRRKIDLRLMPILWIMYILNYIDRNNIVRTSPRRLQLKHLIIPTAREMLKQLEWRRISIWIAPVCVIAV